jgi:ubiquitin carboxyl-terminal hydrolase 7
MYLDVADSGVLPYGWTRYAQFSLSVVNQIHNKFTIRKGTSFYDAIYVLTYYK